jgi:DNA-binding NarL/FixJ family response regulator
MLIEDALRAEAPSPAASAWLLLHRADVSPDLPPLLAISSDPARAAARDVEALHREIRDLWRETDPGRVVRVATAALAVGRGSECRAALWTVVENSREGGDVTAGIRAISLLCADGFVTGRWDECVRLADEGADLCAIHGHRLLAGPLRVARALVAAARGDLGPAAAHRGDRALGRDSQRVAALAALADDDLERAYEHASAIAPAGSLPAHNHAALAVALDLVEVAQWTGRTGEATRHARAMRRAPLAARSPRFGMLALGADAIATSPDGAAADLFEEALATVGGERWAFDHARIQLAYGRHLRRNRSTAPARRHLDAALATFRWLRAEPWIERTRDELRAVGARTGASTRGWGRPTLAPHEHEVASLAASGLTNKQIARRLHLSPRTVSARLYQVFPKLGVTSRAGLRDALTGLAVADERRTS